MRTGRGCGRTVERYIAFGTSAQLAEGAVPVAGGRTTEWERLREATMGVAKIAATVAVLSAATAAVRYTARRIRRYQTEGNSMNEVMTDVGPVDLAVIRFTGNHFTGNVAPALLDLVRSGTVRVIDALFVTREADGRVASLEIADLGPELQPAIVAVNGGVGMGLLDAEDVADVGADLEPNTSVLLLVFENTWAAHFAGSCRRAGGELMDIARIPSQTVAGALALAGAGRPIGA